MGQFMIWETPAHREAELAVAVRLVRAWGLVDFHRYPELALIDFHMRGRKSAAYVEIKCRNYSRTKFATLIISTTKMDESTYYAERQKTPFALVIKWEEGIFWRWLTTDHLTGFSTKICRKYDQSDPDDTELCYQIPVISFRQVKELADDEA
jgi:hypothetical protein